MTVVDWVMDATLACVLPLLTLRILMARAAKAVVLFIAFGLLSALAWTRLSAPDVALVEAAVGAGLTGALLMMALGRSRASARLEQEPRASWRPQRMLLIVLLIALGGGISSAILSLPAEAPGLGVEVAGALGRSGVSHPVTAVLLGFRAYDTLLEVAVLLVAALGVQTQVRRRGKREALDASGPMLPVLARLVVPGLVLVAGYQLWVGSHAPGGAFQAGVLLGAGGILLILSGAAAAPSLTLLSVRALLCAGPLVFLAAAVIPLLAGKGLLEYPAAWAGSIIFSIEAALSLSIGLMLTLFFPDPSPPRVAAEGT